ncbi:tail fiber domain-containing protein [Leclercia sp. W17]|uniref:tail fiber domain-containing protein n=1 Tax=Leclercia sp. W17 TaxID=2282309 RepID=UPI000DF175BA|nr:tail fiber domain-containing protein [Leclercia sp. W17]AXF65220.1 tail fiber domain-containing protein [Leclercia sp. W17]
MSVITAGSSFGTIEFLHPPTKARMSYAFSENYGDIVFVTTVAAGAGTDKYYAMRQGGNFTTQGNISCVSLTQTSDADKKDDIKPIENALDKVLSLDGVTFNWKDGGLPSAGVIAQQLIDVLPEAVGSVFDDHNHYAEVEETEEVEEVDENGNVTTISRPVKVTRLVKPLDESKRSYTVEYSGVVALCLQAIKELNAKVETLEKKLNPQGTEDQPDVQP